MRSHHRSALAASTAAFCAFVAFSAYAGAFGLVGGGLSFGEEIDDRLPFDSLVLAGVALLCFVAVPMTLAAVSAWREGTHAANVVEAAGVVLVVWIAVELAFIKTYSWFHPTYLAVAVVVIGLAAMMRGQRAVHETSAGASYDVRRPARPHLHRLSMHH